MRPTIYDMHVARLEQGLHLHNGCIPSGFTRRGVTVLGGGLDRDAAVFLAHCTGMVVKQMPDRLELLAPTRR